ncbi:smr (Small MutS Related) domain-containing protein [Striga asiatica]|uniref:Smr (Small MutS Related) domain-containing protein n=1 Tax=Striga asiatica TaxID=4170 RepID=A0A5A7RIW6_STRAF|nr:smr (Small MutS Related) domain-containing protein [Striga asiatica]
MQKVAATTPNEKIAPIPFEREQEFDICTAAELLDSINEDRNRNEMGEKRATSKANGQMDETWADERHKANENWAFYKLYYRKVCSLIWINFRRNRVELGAVGVVVVRFGRGIDEAEGGVLVGSEGGERVVAGEIEGGVGDSKPVDNSINNDLNGVHIGQQMDDLHSMLHNPNSLELLPIIASVHHERVGQPLNYRALSFPESLCLIPTMYNL